MGLTFKGKVSWDRAYNQGATCRAHLPVTFSMGQSTPGLDPDPSGPGPSAAGQHIPAEPQVRGQKVGAHSCGPPRFVVPESHRVTLMCQILTESKGLGISPSAVMGFLRETEATANTLCVRQSSLEKIQPHNQSPPPHTFYPTSRHIWRSDLKNALPWAWGWQVYRASWALRQDVWVTVCSRIPSPENLLLLIKSSTGWDY